MVAYAGLSFEENYQTHDLEKIHKRLDYYKDLHMVKPPGAQLTLIVSTCAKRGSSG